MGFNFPNSPALNDTYAPVGGPVFTWDGVAWKGTSQGAPVTVHVSDTAPLSPAIGQLWWNSTTGTMAIWYADSDSAQWVQVSGQVLPTAPSDNGEYVMVNGVWRLVRQSFNLAGLASTDVPVPTWGPKQCRISLFAVFATITQMQLRLSGDGTTFLAGATDYSHGAALLYTGTGLYQPGSGSGAFMPLTGNGDNANIPQTADIVVRLTHTSGYTTITCHGTTYATSPSALHGTFLYRGYLPAALPGPVKALRWLNSNTLAASSGEMTVDWLQ